MKCPKCNCECILCPADWSWEEDFWICPKCEGTYYCLGED